MNPISQNKDPNAEFPSSADVKEEKPKLQTQKVANKSLDQTQAQLNQAKATIEELQGKIKATRQNIDELKKQDFGLLKKTRTQDAIDRLRGFVHIHGKEVGLDSIEYSPPSNQIGIKIKTIVTALERFLSSSNPELVTSSKPHVKNKTSSNVESSEPSGQLSAAQAKVARLTAKLGRYQEKVEKLQQSIHDSPNLSDFNKAKKLLEEVIDNRSLTYNLKQDLDQVYIALTGKSYLY